MRRGVPRVISPRGNVIAGGTVYVYYGTADKYIGVATCGVEELLDHLRRHPFP